VTVPYVDLILDNPPARAPYAKVAASQGVNPRLYYSQVAWLDQVKIGEGNQVMYRFNEENFGGYGDLFWADATAFRPLTADDVSTIHPDVDPATKSIIVNLNYETLSCLEGTNEVYFCRVSTGAVPGLTPISDPSGYAIYTKTLSTHMSNGNAASGSDGPAISWTSFFYGQTGCAIHSATWHNDFGTPRSHGCVNCRPEDAKWIFRWTQPAVPLIPGELDWGTTAGSKKGPLLPSTHVVVVDSL
jgi:hypothetical protein